MRIHTYDDMHADPMADDISYEEPTSRYDQSTDSFADSIPYEMMGYASDRFSDDETDEDPVRIDEDDY